MIEHNPSDEEIVWAIDDRIVEGCMMPATPAVSSSWMVRITFSALP